jgi:transposase
MNFENRPTHSLRPYPGNARTHSPKQIKQISRSINRFGFNNPVLVDDDDQIIAGHGRVEAAKLLNMKTVPTVRLSHLSEVEKRAYILADNRLAEKAGWDNDLLAIELQGLVDLGFDVLLTGFEPAEVDIIIEGIGDESDQPENLVPEEASGLPVSRLGDVWMLGKHILVCGDSTDAATYKLLMDDDKAEFVFTDPPYNVKIDGNVSVSVREEVESYESFVIQERWPDSEGPPMWTNENRARYDRSHLRYPSDLSDDEWRLVEPLIPPGKRGGDKRTVIMREVVNGLMYILSTGCQWRAIPKDLPPRSTLYDYFDLWSWDGTLDLIHHELYVKCREAIGREASPTAAVIDSQSVKSAEKGGLRLIRRATTRERRSRARSGTFSSIRKAC